MSKITRKRSKKKPSKPSNKGGHFNVDRAFNEIEGKSRIFERLLNEIEAM